MLKKQGVMQGRINARVPANLAEWYARRAEELGLDKSYEIRLALEAYRKDVDKKRVKG